MNRLSQFNAKLTKALESATVSLGLGLVDARMSDDAALLAYLEAALEIAERRGLFAVAVDISSAIDKIRPAKEPRRQDDER